MIGDCCADAQVLSRCQVVAGSADASLEAAVTPRPGQVPTCPRAHVCWASCMHLVWWLGSWGWSCSCSWSELELGCAEWAIFHICLATAQVLWWEGAGGSSECEPAHAQQHALTACDWQWTMPVVMPQGAVASDWAKSCFGGAPVHIDCCAAACASSTTGGTLTVPLDVGLLQQPVAELHEQLQLQWVGCDGLR